MELDLAGPFPGTLSRRCTVVLHCYASADEKKSKRSRLTPPPATTTTCKDTGHSAAALACLHRSPCSSTLSMHGSLRALRVVQDGGSSRGACQPKPEARARSCMGCRSPGSNASVSCPLFLPIDGIQPVFPYCTETEIRRAIAVGTISCDRVLRLHIQSGPIRIFKHQQEILFDLHG
jgi:hypothetical protein